MEDNLQKYLDSVRGRPFDWAEHCALFAARGVDAEFGTSYAQRVAAFGVRSALEYRRMQRAGATLESLTTAELGESAVSGMPERGWPVLVDSPLGQTLGIAVPPVVLVASANGYAAVPMSAASKFWRVERCRK